MEIHGDAQIVEYYWALPRLVAGGEEIFCCILLDWWIRPSFLAQVKPPQSELAFAFLPIITSAICFQLGSQIAPHALCRSFSVPFDAPYPVFFYIILACFMLFSLCKYFISFQFHRTGWQGGLLFYLKNWNIKGNKSYLCHTSDTTLIGVFSEWGELMFFFYHISSQGEEK